MIENKRIPDLRAADVKRNVISVCPFQFILDHRPSFNSSVSRFCLLNCASHKIKRGVTNSGRQGNELSLNGDILGANRMPTKPRYKHWALCCMSFNRRCSSTERCAEAASSFKASKLFKFHCRNICCDFCQTFLHHGVVTDTSSVLYCIKHGC
jgi:hypothetical protein